MNSDYYKAYEDRYKKVHEQGKLWEYDIPSSVVLDFLISNNVKKEGKILDLGCGEGRDAIYLLNRGYNVTAIDYSISAINKCNQLSNNKYKDCFKSFDIFQDILDDTFDYIYSISVLHMFVLTEHRNSYLNFIYNHLNKNGKALITVLGDGTLEKKSNIDDAFLLNERTIQETNEKIYVTSTSCCIVNWSTLENEVKRNSLKIDRKWISNEIPGFNESMCIVVRKN